MLDFFFYRIDSVRFLGGKEREEEELFIFSIPQWNPHPLEVGTGEKILEEKKGFSIRPWKWRHGLRIARRNLLQESFGFSSFLF